MIIFTHYASFQVSSVEIWTKITEMPPDRQILKSLCFWISGTWYLCTQATAWCDINMGRSVHIRGEYMSKKIWNCLYSNLGFPKLSVLINQKIFKTVYQNFLKTVYQHVCLTGQPKQHNLRNYCTRWGIYFSLSKNCLFYIIFYLKFGRTSAHIFRMCLV